MSYRSVVTLSLKCLGVMLLGSSFLWAQTLVEQVPPEFEEPVENWVKEVERNTSPFYKQRFTEEPNLSRLQFGQYATVAADMISTFEVSDWGDNEVKQRKILNYLTQFQGALAEALRAPGIEGPLDTPDEQSRFLEAFNNLDFGLNSLGIEPFIDANDNEMTAYFVGTENELVLFRPTEKNGQDLFELLLSPVQMREWRLLAHALSSLIEEQVRPLRTENVDALKRAVGRWENFLNHGYSQMPWESAINGWLIDAPGFPQLGPPDHQWIFLHPTLGLELSVDPLDETRVKEVMHIELLGHIWYRGAQLDDFRGLSVATSLREDLDPGIGFMWHIKRNWSIGMTWHDVDADPFLFFSVDLFSFAKENASEYVQQYRQIRSQLGLN